MPKDTARGFSLVLLSAVGYGSASLLAKVAYSHGAGTITVLTGRFTLAAVLLWLYLTFAGPREKVGLPDTFKVIAAGIGGNVVVPFLYFSGLQRLPLPVFVILSYTYPAMVTILAYFCLKEPLSGHKLAALALTTVGCGVMFWSPGLKLDPGGIILTLASAALYSLYILTLNQFCRSVSPKTALTYTASIAALCFLFYSLTTGETWQSVDPPGWAAIAAMAVFSTAVASVAFFTGAQIIGPSHAALASTAEPVFTFALAGLLCGEPISPNQIAGGVLVTGALLLLNGAAQIAGPSRTAADEADRTLS